MNPLQVIVLVAKDAAPTRKTVVVEASEKRVTGADW
jgi:hypothetical protein